MKSYKANQAFYAEMNRLGCVGLMGRLREIEDVNLRARVGCLVWWDMADQEGWNPLSQDWKELLSRPILRRVFDAEVKAELIRLGYPKERADKRMEGNRDNTEGYYDENEIREQIKVTGRHAVDAITPEWMKRMYNMYKLRDLMRLEEFEQSAVPVAMLPHSYEEWVSKEMAEDGRAAVEELVDGVEG